MNGTEGDEDKSSLSSPNYDALINLNQIFPDSCSLNSLPAIQLHLTTYALQLDKEIKIAAPLQRQQQEENQKRINELHAELEDLFKNVEAVQAKAENADRVMGDLTREIQRLDAGKRNLTTSMTALKRLQMLSICNC